MSISRALSVSSRCQRCHGATLDSFLGLAGLSLHQPRPWRAPTSLRSPNQAVTQRRRPFSVTAIHRSLDPAPDHEAAADQLRQDDIDTGPPDDVPWYLKVQDVEEPEDTLLERQQLPEIPSDAPPQLAEIIKHLSEGIGMESIKLLDLRSLDPPPALGSNLIMIVSTARSIRHLNVSADRLCRWMRATYKIRPHADGLLGRRELKLKLRRKARRAKILGSKPRSSNVDDGITTGWICVNIGALETTDMQDKELHSSSGAVIGFGQQSGGINLVVQMLTEDKRESLKLEELWEDSVKRQIRRDERRNKDVAEVLPMETSESTAEADIGYVSQGSHLKLESGSRPMIFHAIRSNPSVSSQQRCYHTATGRSSESFSDSSFVHSYSTAAEVPPSLGASSNAAGTSRLTEKVIEPSAAASQKLRYLKTHPIAAEAIQQLGKNWRDSSSTAFLTSFYGAMSTPPSQEDYRTWLDLIQHAIAMGHPGYDVTGLRHVVQQMDGGVSTLPTDVIQSILDVPPQIEKHNAEAVSESARFYIDLFEHLSSEAPTPRNQAIFDTLLTNMAEIKGSDLYSASEYFEPHLLVQLERVARKHYCTISDVQVHLTVIEHLIATHNWTELWDFWTAFPIREQPRSSDLYAAVFRHTAQTQHQRACVNAIRRLTATMTLEDPPVVIADQTAEALVQCLVIADPEVEDQWTRGGFESRPHVKLYQACMDGLRDQDWYEEDQYTL